MIILPFGKLLESNIKQKYELIVIILSFMKERYF